MEKRTQINLWYVLAAIFAYLFITDLLQASRQTETLPYSDFRKLVAEGRIAEARVGQTTITGRFREPIDGRQFFVTQRVDEDLAEELLKGGVTFTGSVPNTFLSNILSWTVPALVFFGLWWFVVRRFADKAGFGGLMSVGKSKAKVYVEKNTGVTFADVAGCDEAKAELEEIVAFLKDPETYGQLGARPPKGVLLVGPPGTGKTLLARAVAGEAGVPFFSISGSEFVEMFVGVGAARVRDLFEQARQAAPCIIFIDELDALGRARTAGPISGGYDEKEQTLNQLLVELDGFDPSVGIIVLAATNRPEILDPALTRAGRFDRQVTIDRPDKKGRRDILAVHVRKVKLAPDVDLDALAGLTPGFTGADLANLVNEAALAATRARRTAVTMEDFTVAIERIVAGIERRSRLMNEDERRRVAYHELGHALVALAIPGMDPVHKVSIIPRGVGALGYTLQRPTEDRFLLTERDLKGRMAVLLGGRAAEDLVFGEISTGAQDDLMRATEIARGMVTRYGMTERLGEVAYETETSRFLGLPIEGGGRRFSEETAREIDLAVKDLVREAHERAKAILAERRAELDRLAAELLKRETLGPEDLPKPAQARNDTAVSSAA
ncbi:MAG: ATP-dependent zinc metalloprotease FtsH [Elioraea sp.]|nr:ATP-dependent zinc metalloprotease FtsH [Elioraea sp.]